MSEPLTRQKYCRLTHFSLITLELRHSPDGDGLPANLALVIVSALGVWTFSLSHTWGSCFLPHYNVCEVKLWLVLANS